ncbi:hypothetical protein DICVIV_14401 [Dictyocaulus viviparus]|uniref:ERAP1-like C-terminal domain-containing protein n=1 Tax=Dictyocaulus viviparus TaxID=29172 RepID=A0A0D8X5G3_DICVI|nr:hypothetical protein DICVIV_14401 [Dictyocaulus viviparus]
MEGGDKFEQLFEEEVMAKCNKDNDVASQCVNIAAPLRPLAYCYGVKKGGQEAFDKVLQFYSIEKVQVEKSYLLKALGCSNDAGTLKSLLLLSLNRTASVIRPQDTSVVFRSVSKNPVGLKFMFSFLMEKARYIMGRFRAIQLLFFFG